MSTLVAYRNAGSNVYHVPGELWLRNGIAICGRSISTPARVVSVRSGLATDLDEAVQQAGRHLCAHCYAITTTERESS